MGVGQPETPAGIRCTERGDLTWLHTHHQGRPAVVCRHLVRIARVHLLGARTRWRVIVMGTPVAVNSDKIICARCRVV